ncbi:MAG: hypothetical protein KAG84_01850 [Bacteroidales bacterium]|nr:hypothetical protein [Bacteroidales bacterium]
MIEKIIAIFIIALLLLLLLRYKYGEYIKARDQRQRFKRGNELEKEARFFLEKKGYKVLEEQYEHYHKYMVDGKVMESKLIVDYVVGRKGKVFLIEVKSGKQAIYIKNKNTRRQLLEYDFAIKNDGIFLLDMENEELLNIEFIHEQSQMKYRVLKLSIVLALAVMFIPFIIPKIIVVLLFILFWFYPSFFDKILN